MKLFSGVINIGKRFIERLSCGIVPKRKITIAIILYERKWKIQGYG